MSVQERDWLVDKIGTEILDLAKQYQEGRVPENGTTVPFSNR